MYRLIAIKERFLDHSGNLRLVVQVSENENLIFKFEEEPTTEQIQIEIDKLNNVATN